MAAYENPDNMLVTCPYNPVHRLLKKKMQMHIVICRRNYEGGKKKTCPFNESHIIDEREFKFHVENCPDNGLVLGSLMDSIDKKQPSYVKKEEIQDVYINNSSESWDVSALPSSGYKPKNEIKALIREPPSHFTKSQRKKFYQQLHASQDDKNDEDETPVLPLSARQPNQPSQGEILQQKEKEAGEKYHHLGLGRGAPPSRIAANIFGESQLQQGYNINLGLGRGNPPQF